MPPATAFLKSTINKLGPKAVTPKQEKTRNKRKATMGICPVYAVIVDELVQLC